MRVIDQARLWFREGTSDKVYEVDLVEVAANQYVVNFRFGRRGSALRDGTKTPMPVDLAKARGIYGKLVAEKISGGYKTTAQVAAPAAAPSGNGAVTATGDPAALIGHLRQGARAPVPLAPVVMRVADLDLVDAEPALLELLAAAPPRGASGAWRYLLVSALARCGTTASLPALRKLVEDGMTPPFLTALAHVAIARLDPTYRVELPFPIAPARPDERTRVTGGGGPAGSAGGAGVATRDVEELLITDPRAARTAAVALYVANERPAVLALARVARLSNAEASVVRQLFRIAEVRRDGELYALLARRIDDYNGHTRPFSPETRAYLRRRVARVLRRLGRAGSPDYVRMAAALLVSYNDADAQSARHGVLGAWYDRFARYHALGDILYAHSPRYEKANHRKATWRCARAYRPGGPAPPQREEAFPALWDRAPDVLWSLIARGRATPVVEFAVRALRANAAYFPKLSDADVADVLASGHALAQQLAFEIARARPMSIVLARGALASDVADAHAWVLAWVAAHAAEVVADGEIIALLVTGKTGAIRDAALNLLRGRTLDAQVAQSAAARSLAILLGVTDNDRAAAAAGTLLRVLDAPLREIGADILRDLLRHPLSAVGELAGELILRHAHRDALPGDLIELMLGSPHPAVRTIGGRILAQTPAEIAKDDLDALYLFATSGNAELREATRPLIGAVARGYPDVGRALADRLVDAVLRAQATGVPAHVVSLLRAELAACLPHKPAPTILKLISALSPHARDAGGLLLPQLQPDDLGLDDIARLASHDNVAVRQGAWALARASVARYRVAPVALAKLVDSVWDDTRAFAIAFVRELPAIGADAIIAICDSIRPEVQELGKRLLHEQFREPDAGRYLVRLAEHPSTNIQLLVTTLLDHHASDLRPLVPFLQTVLSQVNRGKVAKERVIALLRREAAKSAETAALLAPLLDRQSATAAITQKHPLIATMVDVHHAFPDVPLPIKLVPPGAG